MAASRASPRCSRPRGHTPRLPRPIRESAGSARVGRVGSGPRGLAPRPIGSSRRAAQRSPQRSAVDPRHTARRCPDQQRRSAIGPQGWASGRHNPFDGRVHSLVAWSATRRRQSALTLGCRVENAAAGTRTKEGCGRRHQVRRSQIAGPPIRYRIGRIKSLSGVEIRSRGARPPGTSVAVRQGVTARDDAALTAETRIRIPVAVLQTPRVFGGFVVLEVVRHSVRHSRDPLRRFSLGPPFLSGGRPGLRFK